MHVCCLLLAVRKIRTSVLHEAQYFSGMVVAMAAAAMERALQVLALD